MDNLLQKLISRHSCLASGHRSCRGCLPVPVVARHILRATDKPVIVACATSCMEVTTTPYPQTAWRVPWIHSVFANAAATMGGVVSAYEALKERGKLAKISKKLARISDLKFVAFGGDGGSYDIGLQSLSGALERQENFLYVCYNNEAYQNTGNQRSGATPYGAATTITPPDDVSFGKPQFRKNLTEIVAAHNIPYVAQTAVSAWQDLYEKAKKAFAIRGPAFINILAPCTLGWKFPPNMGVEISRLAVETCFWPLYEVENGKYKLNYQPKNPRPVTDFLKLQGRFKHLFSSHPRNKKILQEIQEKVDLEWEKLLKKCKKK
ncbi:MAG: thiamine pyrophosphate-dependent enzyme [Patescibacteria group bacterium]